MQDVPGTMDRYHGPLTNGRHCFQRKHLMGSINPSGIERKIPKKKAEKSRMFVALTRN
jgi:hypothetical protein